MPRTPLSQLRPEKFPKIGDEEFAFDSYDEETTDGDTNNYVEPEAETPEVKVVNFFDANDKHILLEEEVETEV